MVLQERLRPSIAIDDWAERTIWRSRSLVCQSNRRTAHSAPTAAVHTTGSSCVT